MWEQIRIPVTVISIVLLILFIILLYLLIAGADTSRKRRYDNDNGKMQTTNLNVHICPILMRTVKFEDGRCVENCNEADCPVCQESEHRSDNGDKE